MGERTSVLVQRHAAKPNSNMAAGLEMAARQPRAQAPEMPDFPQVCQRTQPEMAPERILELLAEEQSMDGVAQIAELMAQPQRHYVEPPEWISPAPRLRAISVSAQQPIGTVVDTQAAGKCCSCSPCNLL